MACGVKEGARGLRSDPEELKVPTSDATEV